MKEITQYPTIQKYFLDEEGFLYGRDGKMTCTSIYTVNGSKTMTRDKWYAIVYLGAPTDSKFYTYKNYKGELCWSPKQTWKPNSYVSEIDDYRTTHIYFLCDKKDGIPRYVGKTDNPKKRFNSHKRESLNNRRGRSSHKQHWINNVYKNGSSIEMVLIDQIIGDGSPSSGDWRWLEEYWGTQMTQWGFPIIFDGGWGHGGQRRKRTIEEKKQIRQIQSELSGRKTYVYEIYEKKKYEFPSNNEAMRFINENVKNSRVSYNGNNDTMIDGKYLFSYKNYTFEEIYQILKDRTNWDMKVLQMDFDFENILNEFNTAREAVRKTGIGNVMSCLDRNKKNRKSSGGYRWVYKLDYIYLGLETLKKNLNFKNKGFVYTSELVNDCVRMNYNEAVEKYKGTLSHGTVTNIKKNPEKYLKRIGMMSTNQPKKSLVIQTK
jgi:hypothetical protein